MKNGYICGLIVGSLLFGTACTGGSAPDNDASSSASSTPAAAATASTSTSAAKAAPASKCRAIKVGNDWLPDQKCTPGLVNRHVTQTNIKSTICIPGWAEQQRRTVPESWYASHKLQSISDYGQYAGASPKRYEYDHRVPVSLAGLVGDTRNLWAEAGATPNDKDAIEAAVLAAVRDGRMTLSEARTGFEKDWTKIKVPPKGSPKKTAGCAG